MVAEVRLNLGCVSERVLDKKVGLYDLSLVVSVVVTWTVSRVEYSPIVELIRTLPKTDFRNIVDHFTSQTGRSEVGRGIPFGFDSDRISLAADPRMSHSTPWGCFGSPPYHACKWGSCLHEAGGTENVQEYKGG